MKDCKESFLMYYDQKEIWEILQPDECKELILAIYNFKDNKFPILTDRVKLASLSMFKQLLRDASKWEMVKKKRSIAGRIGGLKTQHQANQANASSGKLKQTSKRVANQAVTVTVTDTVTDTVTSKLLDKSNKSEAHGNENINFLMTSFKEIYGYPPTDQRARWNANTLLKRISKTVKSFGKEPIDENIKTVFTKYMGWINKQPWGENVQGMETLMRKYPIYESLISGGENVSK